MDFGYSLSESVVGYHFFGDLTELMFYAKNIGKNLEILDLQIQYPPTTLFFLKLFQNLELVNILFILLLVSVVSIVIAISKFELEVNKYLFLFVIIFTSKSFLFSIDRGNLEFFVFAIFLLGLAFKKENQKLSIVLFIFAASLKPSVLLLMIFLKFSSLFFSSYWSLDLTNNNLHLFKSKPLGRTSILHKQCKQFFFYISITA